jgi:hypothetical protein
MQSFQNIFSDWILRITLRNSISVDTKNLQNIFATNELRISGINYLLKLLGNTGIGMKKEMQPIYLQLQLLTMSLVICIMRAI